MSDQRLLHTILQLKEVAREKSTWTRVALLVAVMAGLITYGPGTLSYVSTAARLVGGRVQEQIPVEFELERARTMVTDLIPDLRKNIYVIAQEKTAVEHLRADVARQEGVLGEQRTALLALRDDVNNESGTLRVGTRPATSEEVREELGKRFGRFQTLEATLDAQRQLLSSREKSLAAAEAKLKNMLDAKRDLEAQIEHLQAKLRTQQSQVQSTAVAFDDNQVARCQKLVDEVRVRLDVADKLVVATQQDLLAEDTPTAMVANGDVCDEIDAYFAQRNGDALAAGAKN
ncbi:MAG: hypothetical protein K1X74_16605 [Pirellulales bacterium]|nr:hypothetical protein [Pirellulales bacterium]